MKDPESHAPHNVNFALQVFVSIWILSVCTLQLQTRHFTNVNLCCFAFLTYTVFLVLWFLFLFFFLEATRWEDLHPLIFTQECARWKINTFFTVFTVVASLQQITVYMQPNEVMYHNSADNIQLHNVAPRQRKDLSDCSSLTASRRHAGRNVHRIYIYLHAHLCLKKENWFPLFPNAQHVKDLTSSHPQCRSCSCLDCISHCWCSEAACQWPHCPTESWRSSPPSLCHNEVCGVRLTLQQYDFPICLCVCF